MKQKFNLDEALAALQSGSVLLLMKQIKFYLYFGITLFSMALISAFYYGNFFLEAGLIYDLVWGRLMLLDLYVGFVIFSSLILFFEKSWLNKILWIVSLLCIGNLIAIIYILYRYEEIYHSFKKEKE